MRLKGIIGGIMLLLSLGNCLMLQAQELPELRERHIQLLKSIRTHAQKKVLKAFAKDFQNFSLSQILPYFDEVHYAKQTNMYFTDTFMFKNLGEVGKRDTNQVNSLYLKETLGLTQADEAIYLANELENFSTIQEDFSSLVYFYYYGKVEEENWDEFFFVLVSKTGRKYLGRFRMRLENWKIFGALG